MCVPAFLLILSFLGSIGAQTDVRTATQDSNHTKDHCPACVNGAHYCDPTWLPKPNLNRALTGIDIAKKLPMSLKPDGDPSIKQVIFNSVFRQDDGKMVTYEYLHLKDYLACSSEFESTSYTTFEAYIHGHSESSMSSWSVGYEGPTIGVDIPIPDIGKVSISMPPNTASYGNSNSESSSSVDQFFNAEGGSISYSKARCSIYNVEVDTRILISENLHPGFVEAIKKIDLAKTADEKKNVMEKFIDRFGSHYASKSIMGIGAEFETRYTAQETRQHNEEKRNKCSSESGGLSIFGFSAGGSHAECKGSLEDTTTGEDTSLARFKTTTYGTLPVGSETLSGWGDMVQNMINDGTLAPLPTNQELHLILDLFGSTAVADIEHSPGHKVDVRNIFATAVEGYSKYCSRADCNVPACANNVLVKGVEENGIIFSQVAGSEVNGRPMYKNSENLYLYLSNEDGWIISNGFYEINYKNSPCPQKGVEFLDFDNVDGGHGPMPGTVDTWKDCSNECFKHSKCQFWQHNDDTHKCSLIKDYETAETTTSEISTGARDCKGNQTLFAYDLCVENMMSRSMWGSEGSNMFEKDITVEAFDPDFLIIAGGDSQDDVEFIDKKYCSLPPLKDVNKGGNLIFTAGDRQLLNCFGRDKWGVESDLCYIFDVSSTTWKEHSTLTNLRFYSTAITMPDGVYFLGGFYSGETSDFLRQSERNWQRGPNLQYQFTSGCGVKISDAEFALIGGYYSAKMVSTYNVETGSWKRQRDLVEERIGHSCAFHPPSNSIIVAGGLESPSTTEVIPVDTWRSSKAGDLIQARHYHAMVTVGGKYPKIYAIGGLAESGGALSSVELWDGAKQEWRNGPDLSAGRFDFQALAVPHSAICM